MADDANLFDRGCGFPIRKIRRIAHDVVIAEGVVLGEAHEKREQEFAQENPANARKILGLESGSLAADFGMVED